MEKKESINDKNMKKQSYKSKKLNNLANSNDQRDRPLPWWVELLFVQIGLPDKLLIKILKANKNLKEFVKNDKKLIFTLFFILTILAYLYPVVKQAKNKLECEAIANDYITKKKNLSNINKKQLNMLSINFCNGGEEINVISNIKR